MGSAVTNVKLGDSVCLYPLNDCGRCIFCATDREHRCAERRVLGEQENGTYAEYVRVPGKSCFSIPSGMSFEESVCAPRRRWPMEKGEAFGKIVLRIGD